MPESVEGPQEVQRRAACGHGGDGKDAEEEEAVAERRHAAGRLRVRSIGGRDANADDSESVSEREQVASGNQNDFGRRFHGIAIFQSVQRWVALRQTLGRPRRCVLTLSRKGYFDKGNQGHRFPAASIEQACSIRRRRGSGCLGESIQLI